MSNISVSFDCGKQRDTGRAWINIPALTGMFWGEAAWEIGDTHSVYVSESYFTIGQAGGPESSVSSDLEHIAGVTSGLHHQSISPASAGNDRG